MEEHKHESLEHAHKTKRGLKSMREKPWMVSTFVLGLLIVIMLVGSFSGLTGKVISEKKAGELIIDFANAQGANAQLSDVSREGDFYKTTLLIQGSEVSVYVTKDGKYFVNSLVPLIDETADNSNTNTQTQDIPKAEKPVVELFVMSHCPYGTQAEKGILPVANLLGDKIDFNIRFVYYAMHPSQGEVEEQLRQYCIQKEQESKYNAYLECFLEEGKSDACLTETKIDKAKLTACYNAADKEFDVLKNKNDQSTWLSGQFPLFNIDKALNDKYSVAGSPTLVINGVQVDSARSPAGYLDTICQSFSDGSVPEECGTQLPAEGYTAGFGWTLSSGSTTNGAQCY